MRYFHKLKSGFFCPTINLDKLWGLVSEQTRLRYAENKDGKAPVIDCVRAVRRCPPPEQRAAARLPAPHLVLDACAPTAAP